MLYFTNSKSECTGCGACASICPQNCISLISDDEGFLYPEADSRCISCGKCYEVCPMTSKESVSSSDVSDSLGFKRFCVAGRHKDPEEWQKSSSGGAFSAMCEVFCRDGDVIFGAKFEGLKVVHDCVYSANDIDPFRKSKYVQSYMGTTYERVLENLEDKRRVLFSGTPCQVAGLRNFLGKEYPNLLCVDLVCHGVGSPGVFQEYIHYLEREHGSRVISFTFRNKRPIRGRLLQHIIEVEFENGERISDDADAYNTAFIQCLFLRPSCGDCAFACPERVGDITLADFKKKYELLPQVKGIENLSTVIVNTEKGARVFEALEDLMFLYPIGLDDVVKTNNPLRVSSRMHRHRDAFFDDLQTGVPIEIALKQHTSVPPLHMKIWMLIPDRVRARIKGWTRWIRK